MKHPNYICPRCGYNSDRKTNIKTHFIRKNICEPTYQSIELTDQVIKYVLKHRIYKHDNNHSTPIKNHKSTNDKVPMDYIVYPSTIEDNNNSEKLSSIHNKNTVSHVINSCIDESYDNEKNISKKSIKCESKKLPKQYPIPIPKRIRDLVWNTYIGDNVAQSKCCCCSTKVISMQDFHCGHVIARSKGGSNEIDNLRPICHSCNLSMNNTSMFEFMKRYGLTIQLKDKWCLNYSNYDKHNLNTFSNINPILC